MKTRPLIKYSAKITFTTVISTGAVVFLLKTVTGAGAITKPVIITIFLALWMATAALGTQKERDPEILDWFEENELNTVYFNND